MIPTAKMNGPKINVVLLLVIFGAALIHAAEPKAEFIENPKYRPPEPVSRGKWYQPPGNSEILNWSRLWPVRCGILGSLRTC